MFLKLTTVDGVAVFNMDRIGAFYEYPQICPTDEEKITGSILCWSAGVKDLPGESGEFDRSSYVEETVNEILDFLERCR